MRKPYKVALSVLLASAVAAWGTPALQVPVVHAAVDANSVDYSNAASVSVMTTGVIDTKFQQTEQRYNGPLVGSDVWRGFFRQGGRDINITLPQDQPVQQLSIELMQNGPVGITYPSSVDFEVNIDNQWYLLGRANTKVPANDTTTTTQVFSMDCNNIKAHLFRIHFPVSVWVMARNIHVMGNPAAPAGDPTSLPPVNAPSASFNRPMSPLDARAHGIHNMLLVYTGSHADEGLWKTDDFLPMVTYRDRDGNVQDRMFDTMLFLPYGDIQDTRVGWQGYIDDLFKHGQQLSALDDAVGQANDQLKNKSYKEKVVVAIPYPNLGDHVWGRLYNHTVSFAGTATDPAALRDRTLAMQWYVQALKRAWMRAGYKHLQLSGLYWQKEQVDYQSQGEIDLIQNSSRYSHASRLPLFWIPYYGAAGLSDWKAFGFDAAWVQPNYVFQGQEADISRLASAEEAAKEYGMGIEIEAPWQVTSDITTHNLYLQMLRQFNKDGIGSNVSLSYYAGSKVMLDAATTENPDIRSVYDETYNLAHVPPKNPVPGLRR